VQELVANCTCRAAAPLGQQRLSSRKGWWLAHALVLIFSELRFSSKISKSLSMSKAGPLFSTCELLHSVHMPVELWLEALHSAHSTQLDWKILFETVN